MVKEIHEIIAPDRVRTGSRRLRIYAGPQWVRPDGRTWTPIHQAVPVAALDGGYLVSYQGEGIQLLPHASDAAALAEARNANRIERGHFGPVLDAAKAPDVLRWNVVAGAGVKREKDAWIFPDKSGDGVKLGLFLQDWRARFGARCVIEGDQITLDLTEAKMLALAPGGTGEINLDPLIAPTFQKYAYCPGTASGWELLHNADGEGLGSAAEVQATNPFQDYCIIRRIILRFDTSAYASPASCVLKMTHTSRLNGAVPHVSVAEYADLESGHCYGEARTTGFEVAANKVGDMTLTNGTTWESPDMVAGEHYNAEASFDLAVCESAHDVDDEPGGSNPPGATDYKVDFDADETYLDLEPGGAGRLMLMGVGT